MAAFFCVLQYKTTDKSHVLNLELRSGNAIKKAIDVIAPIKWVIKAADCLIKKLLINTILK